MADNSRIDDLRRRLQKDPASIAFAQLAEELRRAGSAREAIDVCRAGLAKHPGYLSARVTLGRALMEAGDLDTAYSELTDVLRVAPENLAAIRGLAEVHRRKGELPEALEQYRNAFELARNDPGIDQIVREIRKEIEPGGTRPAASVPVVAAGRPALAPASAPVDTPESAANRRAQRILQHFERWLAAIMAERRTRLTRA
jgi:tetratricopeptide (TPR) repeat protein